jgi:hypothetical protein
LEVRSVGNSQVLKETALIEAFNLKAAIEFVMKNPAAAKEALTDMPPRQVNSQCTWDEKGRVGVLGALAAWTP